MLKSFNKKANKNEPRKLSLTSEVHELLSIMNV